MQDARRKTIDKTQTVMNTQDARLVNMLTAAKNMFQDFFNIFRLQLTLGK